MFSQLFYSFGSVFRLLFCYVSFLSESDAFELAFYLYIGYQYLFVPFSSFENRVKLRRNWALIQQGLTVRHSESERQEPWQGNKGRKNKRNNSHSYKGHAQVVCIPPFHVSLPLNGNKRACVYFQKLAYYLSCFVKRTYKKKHNIQHRYTNRYTNREKR